MKAKNVSLYVLPRTDEHQVQNLIFRTNTWMTSERVKYISGFTGSNAITLVSQ